MKTTKVYITTKENTFIKEFPNLVSTVNFFCSESIENVRYYDDGVRSNSVDEDNNRFSSFCPDCQVKIAVLERIIENLKSDSL